MQDVSKTAGYRFTGSASLIRAGAMALLAAVAFSTSAQAQATDWPNRPVTVIVGYGAGGNTDVMARMASKSLSEELKQTFVVENRVGAGGAIAATYVAQSEPDGYTIFFAASPQIAIVPQIQKVNYDPKKDFAPVSVFGTGPFVLAVNASLPVKTLAELIEYGKKKKINYGSSGVGSVAHLAAAYLMARAGIDAVHVPFRGSAQVTTALLGNQIDMYFGNASDMVPQAKNGKLRLLAVATEKRMKQLPDVPSINETYPGSAFEAWNGFMVPAKTPKPIIEKLAKAVIAAAKDPKNVEHLNQLGIEPNGNTSEEFAAQIKAEQPRYDAAVKAANLKQEEAK